MNNVVSIGCQGCGCSVREKRNLAVIQVVCMKGMGFSVKLMLLCEECGGRIKDEIEMMKTKV